MTRENDGRIPLSMEIPGRTVHNPALAPHVRELIVNVSGQTFADKQGGHMDTTDQVRRLKRFEAEHPEWQVISPASPRSVLRGEIEGKR